jgi:pimeloyl-ACP methyl ester carboxylesterase
VNVAPVSSDKITLRQHDFSFSAGEETLQATIDYCGDKVPKSTVLSLHGGGPMGRQAVTWLSPLLAEHGYPLLRFDHSGHGDSTGDLAKASLLKRRDEALRAAEFLNQDNGITLIGTSMGGAIALEILPSLNVKNLILICPAAYAAEAFAVPFGNGFTDMIRQPHSYQRATTFTNLEKYTGRLLLITAGADEIIPPEVITAYDQHSSGCVYKDMITITGAPHPLHKWLPQHPIEQQKVNDKVLNLIAI